VSAVTAGTAPLAPAPSTDRRPLLLATVAAVVLLAVAALATVLSLRLADRSATANARATVLEVARQDAVDFTTYDYRNLRADFSRFAARTTGSLHDQYAKFAPDLSKRFTTLKVQSQGRVISAGIVQQNDTTASVIVAVNDTIRNANVPKGQIVYDRLALDLTKVGDQWLASGVHEL
jgi:Mce-associated membrane protein